MGSLDMECWTTGGRLDYSRRKVLNKLKKPSWTSGGGQSRYGMLDNWWEAGLLTANWTTHGESFKRTKNPKLNFQWKQTFGLRASALMPMKLRFKFEAPPDMKKTSR